MEQIIADGKKAEELKNKIDNREYDGDKIAKIYSQANIEMEKVRKKHFKIKSTEKLNKKEIEVQKATLIIEKLIKDFSEVEEMFLGELENQLNVDFIEYAQDLLDGYKRYISSLEAEGVFKCGKYNITKTKTFKTSNFKDADTLIEKYKYSRNVKTGEEWIEKSGFWAGLKRFLGFKSGYYEDVTEEKDFINLQKIYDETTKFDAGMQRNVNIAIERIKKETEDLKKYFNSEIDAIQKVMLTKVKELEELLRNRDEIKKKLNQHKLENNWLKDIVNDVERVLKV